MLEKIKNTIKQNNMIEKGDKVLVALSGGCDSVCLCLALEELGICFACAHLNHGIREKASYDEEFAREFASRHNAEFFVKHVNIPALAAEKKISTENAGREERYLFFNEISAEKGFTKIAVAHNKNDNAETFLLNLIRGSGIKGLSGIPPKRDNIIRPLIDVTREEIENYVLSKKETYVTDETNFENDYTRNKIRNIVIPELIEINPNFINSVSKTSSLLKQDLDYIEKMSEKLVEYENGYAFIEKDKLLNEPDSVKARALTKAYEFAAKTSKDFEKKHIDYITEKVKTATHGNIMSLCFGVRCSLRYGKIIFEQIPEDNDFSYTIKAGESVFVKEAGITFTAKEVNADEVLYAPDTEYFNIDGEITIRSRKDGDKIIPFKSKFAKKLKSVLIDKKIDITKREKLPLFEFEGNIIWAYGVVRSNLYKLNKTSKILMIKGDKSL